MGVRLIDAFWDRRARNDINFNFGFLSQSHRIIQTQLNDLVLQEGDSPLEVRQARGGEPVLNDRLIKFDSQLSQKADQVALSQGLDSKRDKDVEIRMADLDQEVREAFTGGAVPVVGEDSVGTVNLRDNTVTNEKLHKNFMTKPWITGSENDLNYIWEEGNYVISDGVKNSPLSEISILTVERAKTLPSNNLVWIKQTITRSTRASEHVTYYRVLQVNESSGAINWVHNWNKLDSEPLQNDSITFDMLSSEAKEKLFESYKEELGYGIVNMNWAQLEHNYSFTENKFVYWTQEQGVHYRDNNNFEASDPIEVSEGEIWRIVTRVPDSASWSVSARGVMLDGDGNFVKFIDVDNGKDNSGVSTFVVPEGVRKIIVNKRKSDNNQEHTHILKLHDFKNIWNPEIGFTKNKFIDSNGTLVDTDSELAVTNVIHVSSGQIIRIANVHGGNGSTFDSRGVFVDHDGGVVAAIPRSNINTLPYQYNDVIVPEGAVGMRINFHYGMASRTDTSKSISINLAIPSKPKYSNEFVDLLDKRVAFYGDSTTWYAGWIRLIQNATGIKPYINGYSSASITTKNSPNSLCEDNRIETLMVNDPEVIFINGGLNDSNRTELGNLSDFKVAMGEEDKSTFYGAYAYIIKKILTIKPSVKIILWTTTFYNVNYNNDSTAPNTSLDYARATKDIAEYFGLTVADVRHNMQANWYTNDVYLSDNIHWSFRGDERAAGTMLRELKDINWISA